MARLGTLDYNSRRALPVRVRLLHWLVVLGAALAAVVIALPSVLRQPTLYTASATVRYDPAMFPNLVADGKASDTLLAQQQNLGGVLEKTKYETLRQYGLAYTYPTASDITITAVGRSPQVATDIANDAADGLARRIEATQGLPLLRKVVGQEIRLALQGGAPVECEAAVLRAVVSGQRPPVMACEQRLLRELFLTQAVPAVAPVQGNTSFANMTPSERSAVARALEVLDGQIRYDQRIAEAVLRGRPTSAERLQALDVIAGTPNKLRADRALIEYMNTAFDTAATMRGGGTVFVAEDATEAAAIPTYKPLKLGIAALVGMIGGVLAVLIDRQVGVMLKLQELWSYRQLMLNMVGRDLKARYKNSLLGYIWSLLNPLLTMLVFWVVFGLLMPANPIPMYPVFLIVALLPWSFAVTSVSGGMRAILDNSNLIKKVYFPREILPITVVLSNFVNYLLALPMMFLIMAGVQWATIGQLTLSWSFIFLPMIIIIQLIFLIGVTLLLSTTAVFFRDTTHIIDILLQLWIFLTPVFFSLEAIVSPTWARLVRWLNPMASIIDFYRDVLYGQATNTIPVPGFPALDGVFRTLLTALVILAFGSYVFHRYSGRFGEEI